MSQLKIGRSKYEGSTTTSRNSNQLFQRHNNHLFKRTSGKEESNECKYIHYKMNTKLRSFWDAVMMVCGGTMCPINFSADKKEMESK